MRLKSAFILLLLLISVLQVKYFLFDGKPAESGIFLIDKENDPCDDETFTFQAFEFKYEVKVNICKAIIFIDAPVLNNTLQKIFVPPPEI